MHTGFVGKALGLNAISKHAAALALGASVSLIAGCASETVLRELDEREANRVIEVLADYGIATQKSALDTGRQIKYSITVSSSQRLEAIRLLNQYELPRRKDQGYAEVFQQGGLIPTSAEERAKSLAALEGEVARALKLVDGILDVDVQVVRPEPNALRTTGEQEPTTTASVTVKYMPGANNSKPLSELQIQAIVAAAVEKLTPDHVVVVMTPAMTATGKRVGPPPPPSTRQGLHGLSAKQLNMVAIAVIGLLVLLGMGLVFSQMRLRASRSRLYRLQSEIAKARRKPAEGAPS